MRVLANLHGLLAEAFSVLSEEILPRSLKDLYDCIQGVFGNGRDR